MPPYLVVGTMDFAMIEMLFIYQLAIRCGRWRAAGGAAACFARREDAGVARNARSPDALTPGC
jgi:hypothetical protein